MDVKTERSRKRGSDPRADEDLLVLVVAGVGVVDDNVVEALDVFEERLVTLVPLGGRLVEKDDALVDEAELNVAQHAGVLASSLASTISAGS